MCGRFTLTEEIEFLQERFEIENVQIEFMPRFNIAPGQDVPVVIKDEQRKLILMRWGLVPFWSKDIKVGYKMINARAEGLADKPSFKNPFKEKRCLVLANGFYEWKKLENEKTKLPIRFVLKGREAFAFAGLWDVWQNNDGYELKSFTIITTQSNELLRSIHDRMPVILQRESEKIWLDTEIKDTKILSDLLKPYPSDLMEGYFVSNLVNSPKNDLPDCIKKCSDELQ